MRERSERAEKKRVRYLTLYVALVKIDVLLFVGKYLYDLKVWF